MGDDGSEIWCHPVAGPIIQAVLDRLGYSGRPSKQIFAAELDCLYEWLREVHGPESDEATSLLRRAAGNVTVDSQHPIITGGADRVASIVSNLNSWYRISGGKSCLRWSDVQALAEYCGTAETQFGKGEQVDWRVVFVPVEHGG